MTACNVVRFRVKPGREKDFIDFHENRDMGALRGMRSLKIVHTGDREYMFVGEWDSMEAIVAARPAMIATLDEFRDSLEDLGNGLGVTDPRSGPVLVDR